MTGLPPNSIIGIVGGGQLGRMSAIAAAKLGYRCHIFTPDADSPAAQVAARTTIALYEDTEALQQFAQAVDVVTFEFENVDAAGLERLHGVCPVRPSPDTLRISQDRAAEKRFLAGLGVPLAPWAAIDNVVIDDAAACGAALDKIGCPAVLKTARLGYDGKGQAAIQEPTDLSAAIDRLRPHPLVLEGFVDFACEISVIVARSPSGQLSCFDVTENRHCGHILDLSFTPARIAPDVAMRATGTACTIAEALQLEGLLAVEMFVDRHGDVLVNEIAPRPHNSGHWTIEACLHSQFDLHVRAVADLPLPLAARHSDAVMKNLVGPGAHAMLLDALSSPQASPHWYAKQGALSGRKMGHVTYLFPRGGLPGDVGVSDVLRARF